MVVVDKILEYDFDVEVDLNRGKKLTLSRKPEIPMRKRYSRMLLPTYIDFTEQDLDNHTVVWKEADENAGTDNLCIQTPKGPFAGPVN